MPECKKCLHLDKKTKLCNVTNKYLREDNMLDTACGSFVEICNAAGETIEAIKKDTEYYKSVTPPIRQFDTGATRDTIEGKLSYVKALSPTVLRRYVEYLDKHRVQPDGNLRDFDNWKQGIDKDVYFDSLGRHFLAAWLLHDGYPASDNHGPVTLEDALCGVIFNSMGWLFEILKERKDNE